ncbi:hypothetical protein A3218_15180 [Pseudomonas chlororaphis]|nr:hypothetical protein A3218_15180 [Pseudomonas chlororaphis]
MNKYKPFIRLINLCLYLLAGQGENLVRVLLMACYSGERGEAGGFSRASSLYRYGATPVGASWLAMTS